MLGHIYSGEVNKIWPVSSKTELLHILAVFVLLKGLAGSAEKILLRQAGGGRGVCCGSVEWKVVWKRVAGPRPPGQVCVAAAERNFPPSPPQHEGCSPQISPD